MLNKITLMGRLTRDPEMRTTASGTACASFTLAVERDFANGGTKETDFIDIVAWRNTAEFVSKYFTKGRMAIVSGRLQIRNWTDKEGGKRRSAEVVAENVYFGDSKPKETQSGYPAPPPGYQAQPKSHDQVAREAYDELQGAIPPNLRIPMDGYDFLQDDDGNLPY